MSLGEKWIVTGLVLAFLVPFTTVILRRIRRGQPFENKGTILPPTPPSV